MANHDKDVVLRAAHNQWRGILEQFGIPAELLISGGPCPKCGGKDRFDFSNVNGNGSIHCRHCASRESGGHVSNGIGAVAWWNNWSFAHACNQVGDHLGLSATPKQSKQSQSWPKICRPAPRHEIYETFLRALGLSSEHRTHLREQRRLGDEAIDRGAYASIDADRAISGIEALCELSEKSKRGEQILATPGFRAVGNELHCAFTRPGILIPVRDTDHRILYLQIRFDDPGDGPRYKSFCFKDQLSGNLKAHHAGDFDPGSTIRVTEGPLKADIATHVSGIPTIAIPGVNQFKLAMDAISAADAGQVLIAMDSDFVTNKEVSKAIIRLAEFCKARDLPYEIETWPAEFKGIDDFLTAGTGMTPDRIGLTKFRELVGVSSEEVPFQFNDGETLARRNLDNFHRQTDGGKLVWHHDQWWKYKDGQYRMETEKSLRSKLQPVIKDAYREEYRRLQDEEYDPRRIMKRPSREDTNLTIQSMQTICRLSDSIVMPSWLPDAKNKTAKPKRYVSMRNGLLDLDKVFAGCDIDELVIPHTADWFSSFKLDYEFDPYARCPRWEAYLAASLEGDQERIRLLQEWAGYLLTSTNSLQRFLAIEGEGGNGKTVFFAGLTSMLGAENISNVPLDKFSSSFSLSSTIGKVANICGDVGAIDSIAEGELKNFTGGGTVFFDRKNKQPLEAIPTAKVMLSWNQRPRIADKSDGIWRRMILVPFNRKVPESEKVIGMDRPQFWLDIGETAGILMWAIAGLMRVSQHGFGSSSISNTAIDDYQSETNPIRDFAEEMLEFVPEENTVKSEVYKAYSKWCSDNGYKPLAIRQFGLNLRRVNRSIEDSRVSIGAARKHAYRGIRLRVDLDF